MNPINPVYNPIPQLQAIQNLNPTASYLNRDTCSICFSNGTNIRLVPCTHQFHVACIVEWCNRRRICPNCNANNFQAMILCSRCNKFNEAVTFCPTGCQKPNHMDCFMQRNQGKLICRNCSANPGRAIPISAVPVAAPPQAIYSRPNYPPPAIVYQ